MISLGILLREHEGATVGYTLSPGDRREVSVIDEEFAHELTIGLNLPIHSPRRTTEGSARRLLDVHAIVLLKTGVLSQKTSSQANGARQRSQCLPRRIRNS